MTRRVASLRWLCRILFLLGLIAPLRPLGAQPIDLRLGMTQMPAHLHPGFDPTLAAAFIHGFTLPPVSGFDRQWQVTCFACDGVPVAGEDVLPDGTRVRTETFTLRSGLTWGDGVPVTAEDVRFGWQAALEPAAGFTARESMALLQDVRALDQRRVQLVYRDLACTEGVISIEILPKHLEEPIQRRDPQRYREASLYVTAPTTPGLWFGPWLVAAFQPGTRLRLQHNPHWPGPVPHLGALELVGFDSTTALMSAVLAGEVEAVPPETQLSLDQIDQLSARLAETHRFEGRSTIAYEHLTLNLDNPILADARVRRALLLAIDRDALNQRLFKGRQKVAAIPSHPDDAMTDPAIAIVPYDPAAAAALLQEAGWTLPDKGDGIRVNASGERLVLPLTLTASDRIRGLTAQAMAQQWRAVGVEVPLTTQAPRVMFGETLLRRQFPAMILFAYISSPRNVPRLAYHSVSIPTAANGWSGQNASGYRSAAMDQAIDALLTECRPAERRALFSSVQQLLAQDLPLLPLFWRVATSVAPRDLTGMAPTGHQFVSSLWATEWQRTQAPRP